MQGSAAWSSLLQDEVTIEEWFARGRRPPLLERDRHGTNDTIKSKCVPAQEEPDDGDNGADRAPNRDPVGLKRIPNALVAEMRIAAAVKWYELEQILQSKGGEIAVLTTVAEELTRCPSDDRA